MKLTLTYDGTGGIDTSSAEVLECFLDFQKQRIGYPVLTIKVHDPENVGIADNLLKMVYTIVDNIEYPPGEDKGSVELEFSKPVAEHNVSGFLIELTAED